ncbi:plasmid stabilization protein ParE [Caulobacter sp. FWC2]|nr:plasmid stabilization protein ParE [Caulobacter sp. FWC2]
MAYRLSLKAEDDVTQIYVTGVEMFGVDQAERYHEGLEQIFNFLSDFPFAAVERTELKGLSRVHSYRSHIIIYRLDGRDILIQRVRHASEDWIRQR